MKPWIDRILLVFLSVIVIAATATAAMGLFSGDHLGGVILLAHTFAGGAMVVVVPMFALFWVFRCGSSITSGAIERLGFWCLIVSGLVTIATIFACMLPVPSTHQMEQLVEIHGYAGFAMVPALLLLIIGAARWRSIQRTRSETPG